MGDGRLRPFIPYASRVSGVQRVEHVEAVGPVIVRVEHDEPGVGQESGGIQDKAQGDPGPLPDRGPPFFAGVPRDLGFRRQPFQIGKREGLGPGDATFDGEVPGARSDAVGQRCARKCLPVMPISR